MNYQRVLIGVAVGAAVAGVGFLMLHPKGKKVMRQACDIALDATDKFIDLLRTAQHAEEAAETSRQRTRPGEPVTES